MTVISLPNAVSFVVLNEMTTGIAALPFFTIVILTTQSASETLYCVGRNPTWIPVIGRSHFVSGFSSMVQREVFSDDMLTIYNDGSNHEVHNTIIIIWSVLAPWETTRL